jgi:ribosomal protein S18 acetylase RimI-like enzyme
MVLTFKAADVGQLEPLLGMVREFYEYDRTPLDERAALSALREILTDSSLGRVYLMMSDGEVAGYVILTLGFSLEHHGRDAFVDEIFVRESYRSRGLGKSCLRFVEGVCRELGVRALHLEVGRENTGAQALYRVEGFVDHDRHLMTKRIGPVRGGES